MSHLHWDWKLGQDRTLHCAEIFGRTFAPDGQVRHDDVELESAEGSPAREPVPAH